MGEVLSNVWVWIVGALSGLSVTGIIAAIIYGVVKGGFNRSMQRLNFEKMFRTMLNEYLERIKQVSFAQNIQPLVESELRKITETAKEYNKKAYEELSKKYDNLIAVMEKFFAYFDDSLVSDTKKKELKEALDIAKKDVLVSKTIEVKEIVFDEIKPKAELKEKPKKTRIER